MPLEVSDHNRKTDRILMLRPKEGEKALSTTGLLDGRLFRGENNLRAVMDPITCLWSFKQDHGNLPGALRNTSFTSFAKLLAYVTPYFKKRNVEIVEVKD